MGKEKEVINNKQFRDIIICIMWPAAINYASGILTREVGRDMWISGIISLFTVLPFIYITINTSKKFPDKTIVKYSQEVLGTVLGKMIGLILTIYFFLIASSSVSMYIHHLSDFLLPQTPFLVITMLHTLVICYLIWKGYEVIGRTSVVAFGMSIIFYLLVFMASVTEIDFNRIKPFFDSGVIPVFKASIKADTFSGVSLLVIAMLFPMVKDKNKAFLTATSGMFIGGFFFVFYFIAELMVMGPQVVALMRIASMDFVRSIQITQYLHRFESFMVALWYWSIMIQAGVLSLCSLESFKETFGIRKKSPFIVIIFGFIMVITTFIIGRNRVFFLYLREHVWQYFAVPIDFGVPLLLFLAAGFRKTITSVNVNK